MRNSFEKKPLATAIVAIVVGSMPQWTAAQEWTLEEVMVTATRRNVSVQDVPYNISAMSGDELRTLGINSAAELFRAATSVNYIEQGPRSGVNNSNLIIRGVNAEVLSRNQGPLQTAPVVSTYIGETPVFVNLRLKDIERVEVLRGPQGTLYGSGSLGGSVRYIYKKPDFDRIGGEISGGLSQTENGDGLNYEADFALNVPLSDTFAVRLNAGYVDSAGFIDQPARYVRNSDGSPALDNKSSDPFGDAANFFAGQPVFESVDGVNDASTESYRLALAWAPSDSFHANMAYQHQSDDVGGTQMNSYDLYGDDSLRNGALIEEPFERDVDIFSLDVDVDMGFASFTASASKYKSEGEGSRDLTGFYELFSFFESYYGTSPRPLIEDISAFEDSGDVFEARLVSTGDSRLDWILGAFYMEQDIDLSARQFFSGYDDYANACFIATGTFGGAPCGFGTLFGIQETNGPIPVVKDEAYLVDQENTFTDRALFGELSWNVSDRWQLTGGIRYYDQDFDTTQVGGLPFVPDGVESRSLSSSDDGTLLKFNSSYQLNETITFYGVWSEGFRRGGANGLPNAAFGAPINPKAFLYNPDTTTNTELGVKGTLAGRYTYTLAYYDIDWENMQSNLSCTFLALLCVVNVGDSSSRGVEAEFGGRLTDHLDIQLGYSYNDSELKSLSNTLSEFIDDGTSFTSVEAGVPLPGASEHTLFIAANYYAKLFDALDVVYGLNGSYRSEAESSLEVTSVTLDSFWLWNASVSIEGSSWSLRGFVNNISDERGLTAADPVATWGERANAIVSLPRTFGLMASYQF